MATKKRLIDLIEQETEITPSGGEEWIVRNGANQDKVTTAAIAGYVKGTFGLAGQQMIEANNTEEVVAALPGLAGFITLDDSGYVTDSDLANYATLEALNTAIAAFRAEDDPLEQYATVEELVEKADLSAVISALATKANASDLNAALVALGLAAAPTDDPLPILPTRSGILAKNDLTSSSYAPWVSAAIVGGSTGTLTSDATHNGYVPLKGGTASGDGYRLTTSQAGILLRAGTMFRAVCAIVTTAACEFALGFVDQLTATDQTDGAYFKMSAGGAVAAVTAAGGTRTTAGTTYSPTVGTFYIYLIEVQAAFAGVRFRIFPEGGGAAVYDVTLATNLPSAVGNLTGSGIIALSTATSSPTIVNVDSLKHYLV
jgi:hypothetical protein